MSIGINGLNSYIDPSVAGAASGTKLSEKLGKSDSDTSAEELKEVCREFESYFLEQVYKEMFKTIGSEEGDGSLGSLVDYFKDGAIQSLAAQTTEQSGGPLAQQLYEQMKRNYGITEES